MAKAATILTKTDGAISFAVDAVDPCQDRVPTELWGKTLTQSTDGRAFASSHAESCPMVPIPGHALATAIHLAFSQHWPLCLSPDVIWITIAQGLAHHIVNHTETLRPIFVGHPGKMCLSAYQGATVHWPTVVKQWCDGIEEQVGSEIADLFVCNFTTTTSITKTVSQVVMMDAFQEYFEYVLRSICGIPTVTLEGTAADWRDILRRVRLFQAFDCPW